MTQEDKELLIRDLSARIPYGVKVCAGEDLTMTLKQIDYKCFCEAWENEDFKCHSRWMFPYLRPMSSMTKEEEAIFEQLIKDIHYKSHPSTALRLVDWLDKNMFDYRGLIGMGLAIEVTKENNPYNK